MVPATWIPVKAAVSPLLICIGCNLRQHPFAQPTPRSVLASWPLLTFPCHVRMTQHSAVTLGPVLCWMVAEGALDPCLVIPAAFIEQLLCAKLVRQEAQPPHQLQSPWLGEHMCLLSTCGLPGRSQGPQDIPISWCNPTAQS